MGSDDRRSGSQAWRHGKNGAERARQRMRREHAARREQQLREQQLREQQRLEQQRLEQQRRDAVIPPGDLPTIVQSEDGEVSIFMRAVPGIESGFAGRTDPANLSAVGHLVQAQSRSSATEVRFLITGDNHRSGSSWRRSERVRTLLDTDPSATYPVRKTSNTGGMFLEGSDEEDEASNQPANGTQGRRGR